MFGRSSSRPSFVLPWNQLRIFIYTGAFTYFEGGGTVESLEAGDLPIFKRLLLISREHGRGRLNKWRDLLTGRHWHFLPDGVAVVHELACGVPLIRILVELTSIFAVLKHVRELLWHLAAHELRVNLLCLLQVRDVFLLLFLFVPAQILHWAALALACGEKLACGEVFFIV